MPICKNIPWPHPHRRFAPMIQLSSSSSKTQVGIFSPAHVDEQETNKTVNTGTTINRHRCFRLEVASGRGERVSGERER